MTFPAVERHRPQASTKLYCLVTEAHRCEKLAQSFYAVVTGRDSNPRPLDRESDTLPQHHDATFTLGMSIYFQGILVKVIHKGHRVKVKVTGTKSVKSHPATAFRDRNGAVSLQLH